MQNLKNVLSNSSHPKASQPNALSNEALLSQTKALVAKESKLTTEILWHLHEIQKRRLYAEKGYASLFEYAVQALGYSEAAAGRRISAMRLLVEIPEIEPALKSGDVNLSTLSTIQSFLQRKETQRREERPKTAPISKKEKQELVFALQGKSKRECEKHLIALDPAAATPKERERVISTTQTEIRFVADEELMEKLKQIKELDGHVQNKPSYLELFHRLADIALKKLDPLDSKKGQTRQSKSQTVSTPPAESRLKPESKNPRSISAALKRAVWTRDRSCCQYLSSDGRRCTSQFALEIDHKKPLAWGGKTELNNLQLLCREHNRQKAVAQIGSTVMKRYLRIESANRV